MGGLAVITGAAGGIGSATAHVFKTAGWTTIGIDRTATAACGADRFVELDLGSPTFTETLTGFLEQVSDIDVLVNNAAVQITKPLAETTTEDWHNVLQVNVVAAAMLIRALSPHMKPGSAVVNVGSVHSVATSPGMAAYVASKGAMVAMTRAAALELAPVGIRVNCVLPGAIDTPMLRSGVERAAAGPTEVDMAFRALARRTPLGHIGSPADIAQAILFLADSGRAAFITGQTLVVDGGATARLSTE